MAHIFKPEAEGRGRENMSHISEYLVNNLFIAQHISKHFFNDQFFLKRRIEKLRKKKLDYRKYFIILHLTNVTNTQTTIYNPQEKSNPSHENFKIPLPNKPKFTKFRKKEKFVFADIAGED